MEQVKPPTLEDVTKALNVRVEDISNCYLAGSRVFGTAHATSGTIF